MKTLSRLTVLVATLLGLLGLVYLALLEIVPDRATAVFLAFVGAIFGTTAAYCVLILIAIVVHELGHFLAGKAVGFRFNLFVAGPIGVRVESGKAVPYVVRPVRFYGFVSMVPPDDRNLTRRFFWFILGGPLASLLWFAASVGIWRLFDVPSPLGLPHGVDLSTKLLALFAAIVPFSAFLVLPGTLLPFRAKRLGGIPTDMLWLIHLAQGGPRARRLVATLSLIQMSMSGTPPATTLRTCWKTPRSRRTAAYKRFSLSPSAGRGRFTTIRSGPNA